MLIVELFMNSPFNLIDFEYLSNNQKVKVLYGPRLPFDNEVKGYPFKCVISYFYLITSAIFSLFYIRICFTKSVTKKSYSRIYLNNSYKIIAVLSAIFNESILLLISIFNKSLHNFFESSVIPFASLPKIINTLSFGVKVSVYLLE